MAFGFGLKLGLAAEAATNAAAVNPWAGVPALTADSLMRAASSFHSIAEPLLI